MDFYSELGVPRSAGPDEIKKAYRKLASELHPDKNQGKPDIEARFKRVNHAYHMLTDAKKRALYDEFGEEGLREGFNPAVARTYRRRGAQPSMEDILGGASGGGAGIGDLFGDLFGGARGGRSRRRAPDVESEVTIEFVSAVRGAELELAVGDRLVKVRIPPGAADGDKVRVKGGGPGGGADPGDLVLTVRVKPHEYFERDGLDLKVDIPISPDESLRGGKVEVPTPGGSVTLRIPAGAQSGQLLRLREKGITRGGKVGDLFVRFLVRIPKNLSPEIEAAAKALSDALDLSDRSSIKF